MSQLKTAGFFLLSLLLLFVVILLTTIRSIDAWLQDDLNKESLQTFFYENHQTWLEYDQFSLSSPFNRTTLSLDNLKIHHPSFSLSLGTLELDLWQFNSLLGLPPQENSITIQDLRFVIESDPQQTIASNKPIDLSSHVDTVLDLISHSQLISNIMRLVYRDDTVNLTILNSHVETKKHWALPIEKITYQTDQFLKHFSLIGDFLAPNYQLNGINLKANRAKNHSTALPEDIEWSVSSGIKSLTTNNILYPVKLLNSQLEGKFNIHTNQFDGHLQGTLNEQALSSKLLLRLPWSTTNPLQLTLNETRVDQKPLGIWGVELNVTNKQLQLWSKNTSLYSVWFLLSDLFEKITINNLEGNIKSFRMSYDLSKNKISNLTLKGQQLGFKLSSGNVDGLNGINIDAHFQNDIGTIKLFSEKNDWSLPSLYSKPIQTKDLNLEINLTGPIENPETITVDSAKLKVYDNEISASVVWKKTPTATLRIETNTSNMPMDKLKKLLPDKLRNVHAIDWIYHNLISGEINATAILEATSDDIFQPEVLAENLRLHFTSKAAQMRPFDDWEVLNLQALDLTYKNAKLNASVTSAVSSVNGIELEKIRVQLYTEKDLTYLKINSLIQGEKDQAYRYLLDSPIPHITDLEYFFKTIDINGDFLGNLTLVIPISPSYYDQEEANQNDLSLDIKLNFEHAKVSLESHTIHNVRGDLQITETGVYTSTMSGTYEGLPLQVKIHQKAPQKPQEIAITSQLEVEKFVPFATGFIELNGLIKLPDETLGISTTSYLFHSDFSGATLHMPAGLAKTTQEKTVFTIQVDHNADKLWFETAVEDKQLEIYGFFDQENSSPNYVHVLFGDVNAPATIPGLSVVADLPDIQLEQWLSFVKTLFLGSSSLFEKFQLPISHTDIRSPQLKWKNKTLNNIFLHTEIQSSNTLSSHFTSEETNATLNWNDSTLSIYIDTLELPQSSTDTANHSTDTLCPPTALYPIPEINLKIDKLIFSETQIHGLATAKGRMTPEGYSFDILEFKGNDNHLKISDLHYLTDSSSTRHDNPSHPAKNYHATSANIKMKAESLDKLLSAFGFSFPAYSAQDIDFLGDFSWKGSPWCFSKENLTGNFSLKTKGGVIANVEPGFAQLLSLLNVKILFQQQPSAKLDKEQTDKLKNSGMGFLSIDSNAKINNGIAKISKFRMESAIAIINMRGTVDSIDETYNLRVQVKPELAPTIVTLSTIFGGPITGLTSLLITELINNFGLDDELLSYYYTVKGSYDKIEFSQSDE